MENKTATRHLIAEIDIEQSKPSVDTSLFVIFNINKQSRLAFCSPLEINWVRHLIHSVVVYDVYMIHSVTARTVLVLATTRMLRLKCPRPLTLRILIDRRLNRAVEIIDWEDVIRPGFESEHRALVALSKRPVRRRALFIDWWNRNSILVWFLHHLARLLRMLCVWVPGLSCIQRLIVAYRTCHLSWSYGEHLAEFLVSSFSRSVVVRVHLSDLFLNFLSLHNVLTIVV